VGQQSIAVFNMQHATDSPWTDVIVTAWLARGTRMILNSVSMTMVLHF